MTAPSASTPSGSPAPRRNPEREGKGSRAALTLRSAEFRKGREAGWLRLDDMVTRIEKRSLGALTAEEVQTLPLLYRSVVSSLSVARNIVLDRNLLLYLENLALRSYLVVYGPRANLWTSLKDFFRRDFPVYVRAMSRHLGVAFLVLMAGILAGYQMVGADMSYYDLLMPEGMAQGRTPASSTEDLREAIFGPWPGFVHTFIVFANSLFRHNTVVGIMAFGLGFSLGIPTLLLLVYNGLTLGAMIALYADRGLGLDFIAWLSIHGVTEILAILLCGAAGLVIAEKILFPGGLTRLDSLAKYGRKAAGVAAGAVLLFFIAGILEGGFRQLINNTTGRLAFAFVTGAFWVWYFSTVGRDRDYGRLS